MPVSNHGLTRRRVLAALLVAGLVTAGAGTVVVTFFGDATGSDVVADQTVDLSVDSRNATVTLVDAADLEPGDSGAGTLVLNNTGDAPGSLELSVDVRGSENGVTDAEAPVEPDPLESELPGALEVNVSAADGAPVTDGWTPVASLEGYLGAAVTVEARERVTLHVEWRVPPDAGREIDSDTALVTATLDLDRTDDADPATNPGSVLGEGFELVVAALAGAVRPDRTEHAVRRLLGGIRVSARCTADDNLR